MVLEGGHLLIFDQGVEYVLVDGRRAELEPVEDEYLYNLKTTGGRFRIAYRYPGGREQVVDIDPSLGDESPSMSFHRESVSGTFSYRRIR